MKLTLVLLALAVLTACAHLSGEGTPAAGSAAADVERKASNAAPRRHQGNLARGGVYDN